MARGGSKALVGALAGAGVVLGAAVAWASAAAPPPLTDDTVRRDAALVFHARFGSQTDREQAVSALEHEGVFNARHIVNEPLAADIHRELTSRGSNDVFTGQVETEVGIVRRGQVGTYRVVEVREGQYLHFREAGSSKDSRVEGFAINHELVYVPTSAGGYVLAEDRLVEGTNILGYEQDDKYQVPSLLQPRTWPPKFYV